MIANPTNVVGISQRVVATLVACAVLLWSIGAYTTAQAANLVSVSDTLSDSDLNVTSAHTISFVVPTTTQAALTTGDSITITFPSSPGGGFTGIVGVDDAINASVSKNGSVIGTASVVGAGQVVTVSNITAVGGDVIEVAIDDGVITNPNAAQSYEIVIATPYDTGKTRVAIIDNVVVTAVVETSFVFTIDGLATSTPGVPVNVGNSSTTGSTTATLIPFGTLTAGVPEALGQQLSVTTNAMNGFVVTVETDGDLESSNGAIIDIFDEGVGVYDTGTAWNAPVADIDNRMSWGHWGMTTNDSDLDTLGGFSYSGEFGADDFIAPTTTPQPIFHHDGPVDGTTQDKGQIEVLYKIQITPLQEAADDYTTTLTYIATPTF